MVFCAGRAPYTFEGELPGGKSMNIHWLQEQIDQAAGVRPFTKWDYEIRRPETIHQVMQRAFQLAGSEPAGPVYVSLPREVLMAPVETARMPAASRYAPVSPGYPSPEALEQASDILAHAQRPLIVTSQAGRHPQTLGHMVELAELIGASVIGDRVSLGFPTAHRYTSAGRGTSRSERPTPFFWWTAMSHGFPRWPSRSPTRASSPSTKTL